MRRKILAEQPSDAEVARLAQFRQVVAKRFDKFFVMGNPPDYEPGPEKSIAAIADARAAAPEEVAYDYISRTASISTSRWCDYVTGDHEPIREMLDDRRVLLGLSDGGAHCTSIIDAGVPSYMLTHWGRDRTRGRGCRWRCWWSARPARREFLGLADRGGSRRDCAPT